MKNVILFGNGDLAEVVAYYLESDSDYKVAAFTIDGENIKEEKFLEKDVVAFEKIEEHYPPSTHKMFIALGYSKMNASREKKLQEAKNKGYEIISHIHSKATVCPELSVGENCFIFENNVIQPFVKIGSNNILWSGNHIGHHTIIGNNNFIASHVVISGRVIIQDNCFICVNATIRDNISIASKTLIGAGAIILKNTKEGEVYPAIRTRPIKAKSSNF